MQEHPLARLTPRPATFSIIARDPSSGELGFAVASKFLAVGALVPTARAGVGAIANQANLDPADAHRALEHLGEGTSAQDALDRVVDARRGTSGMQIGMVDGLGGAAAYTDPDCAPWAGHHIGEGFTCQGNVLAGPEVVDAMAGGFSRATGTLADRLIAALQAGQDAGGDRRGKQSACVQTVLPGGGYAGTSDVVIDLRVDDHPEPLAELARLRGLHDLYFAATPQAERIALHGDLILEVQERLQLLGYLGSCEPGVLCRETATALDRWAGMENFEERVHIGSATIDPPAMDFLRSHTPSDQTR